MSHVESASSHNPSPEGEPWEYNAIVAKLQKQLAAAVETLKEFENEYPHPSPTIGEWYSDDDAFKKDMELLRSAQASEPLTPDERASINEFYMTQGKQLDAADDLQQQISAKRDAREDESKLIRKLSDDVMQLSEQLPAERKRYEQQLAIEEAKRKEAYQKDVEHGRRWEKEMCESERDACHRAEAAIAAEQENGKVAWRRVVTLEQQLAAEREKHKAELVAVEKFLAHLCSSDHGESSEQVISKLQRQLAAERERSKEMYQKGVEHGRRWERESKR